MSPYHLTLLWWDGTVYRPFAEKLTMDRRLLTYGLEDETEHLAPNYLECLAEILFYTIHVLAALLPLCKTQSKP